MTEPATFSVEEVATMLGVDDWLSDTFPLLPARATTGAYVYFALCESPGMQIKIGHATSLTTRMSGLQVGCPYRIRMVAYFHSETPHQAELDTHFSFASDHIGGEWFRPSPFVVAAINEHRRNLRLTKGGRAAFSWRGRVRPL